MKRDIKFAKKVDEQAKSNERNLIVTDGNNSDKLHSRLLISRETFEFYKNI